MNIFDKTIKIQLKNILDHAKKAAKGKKKVKNYIEKIEKGRIRKEKITESRKKEDEEKV